MTWGTPNKKVDFISRQHVKDRKAQHGWAVTSHHWVSLLVSLSCNIWWCWPCHTTDLINQWPTTTGHLMMLTIGALVNKGVRPAHNDLICIGWGSSMASILVCSCSRCSHQYVIKTPPSEVTPNIPTNSTYPWISHVFVGKGGTLENTAVCGLLSSAVAPIPRWMVSTNSGTSNSIWNMAIHRHSL